MSEVQVSAEKHVAPSGDSLNTTFGLPESLRKIVAGGLIAATAFLSGCARTIEDRISDMKALPAPPAATVVEHSDWFKGDTIRLTGTPHFERDESYNTTSIMLIPISSGKTTTLISVPHTVHHSQFLYTLKDEEGGGLSVRSSTSLDANPLVISGRVVVDGGSVCIDASDHVTVPQFQAFKTK